jgi:hypothetical protein
VTNRSSSDAATAEFPDPIVFRDETRAARKQHRRTQVDFIYEKANQNLFFREAVSGDNAHYE